MMFIGLKDGPVMQDLPLHHPRFLPPNEVVKAVARAQAVAFAAVMTFLQRFPARSTLQSPKFT